MWVRHFAQKNTAIEEARRKNRLLTHPFVIGELACGALLDRRRILEEMSLLPQAVEATHAYVRHFVEREKIWGRGIGWIDAHLLASALQSGCRLWTLDIALARIALRLRIAYAGNTKAASRCGRS